MWELSFISGVPLFGARVFSLRVDPPRVQKGHILSVIQLPVFVSLTDESCRKRAYAEGIAERLNNENYTHYHRATRVYATNNPIMSVDIPLQASHFPPRSNA
jgi:hypothetical protein